MKIFQYLLATFVAIFILVGCASKSNYAPKEVSDNAKLFNKPSDGKTGIYIYRIVSPGGLICQHFIGQKKINLTNHF